jgi:AcrR family transcriptional regulator
VRADAQRNRAAILAAAEVVFARDGPAASTEQVAALAGVAIGTVFRHFPTKDALLRALMKDVLARLSAEATELIQHGDPGTSLFLFFADVVAQAAAKKTVADLLATGGPEVTADGPVAALNEELGALLSGAQSAGTARADVGLPEVAALLAATSDAALRAGWDEGLQKRALAVIFAGLRP